MSSSRNILTKLALTTLTLTSLFALQPTLGRAQQTFYPLIVNGSSNLAVNYERGYLIVHFRRTRNGAGASGTYTRNVPPGTAAWVDRPLNDQEPSMLKQKMTDQQAEQAISRLKQNGGYWKFYCRNPGQGYFEVSRSEPAYASVRID